MIRIVDNGALTPLQSLPQPADASPSPSQSSISPPPQAKVQAPSQTSFATPTGVVKNNLMHKSDLNSYCQKFGIPLPVYQTSVEGYCAHALRFRSTVWIGKTSFTSPNTFANRKSGEQDAAKLALEHLVTEGEATSATNQRVYLRKLVSQDKARCKMILNEFAAKIKMECAYQTVQVETIPVFVSTLALNGKCYKGEAGKNKKEAEQRVSFVAILSLLDDPTYGTLISKVIKSKFSVCDAFYEAHDIPNTRDCSVTGNKFKITTFNRDATPLNQQVSSIEQSSFRVLVDEKMPTSVKLQSNNIEKQRDFGILINKNKLSLVNSLPQTEMVVNKNNNKQDLVDSLPQTEIQGGQRVLENKQGGGGGGLQTEAVTISRRSYVNLPITSPLLSEPQHEKIKLPEAAEPGTQQINVPVEFVPPAAQNLNLACDTISSKKRRRNKKKANKRLRAHIS